jgi:hypothetical protein
VCPGRAHMARFGYPPVVLVFDLVRLSARSRGSVEERPLHTRKVAGSIPAGTTTVGAGHRLFMYPTSDTSSTTARIIRHVSAVTGTVALRARRAHPPHDRGPNHRDPHRCVPSPRSTRVPSSPAVASCPHPPIEPTTRRCVGGRTKIANALESGNVFINSYGYQSEIPFGGYKMSGIGREHGSESIHEYTQAKSITVGLERFNSRFEFWPAAVDSLRGEGSARDGKWLAWRERGAVKRPFAMSLCGSSSSGGCAMSSAGAAGVTGRARGDRAAGAQRGEPAAGGRPTND